MIFSILISKIYIFFYRNKYDYYYKYNYVYDIIYMNKKVDNVKEHLFQGTFIHPNSMNLRLHK